MKVLITGGAGFIGFHLAKQLASEGHKVVIADNFQRGKKDEELNSLLKQKNVSLITMDVTNEKGFGKLGSGYDHVYHLAAINGTENFYKIPDQVIRVGAVGTINVLDWFYSKNKEGKLLFASSSESYAGLVRLLGKRFPIPTPENVPLIIDDPSNVRWSYAASKILGEVAMFSWTKTRSGNNFVIVRYHNVYGPRMGTDHVIPQFIQRILAKENPFRIFGAENTRSFCYVADAIAATQLVMNSNETNGQIIHIGRSDAETKIIDLAKALFKVAVYEAEIKVEPAPKGAVSKRCPDVSKLVQLGFKPQISLQEGLRRAYEWYEQHKG